jgi:hypothetical protein
MHATMQHLQAALAYFYAAVSYECKMFMKSRPELLRGLLHKIFQPLFFILVRIAIRLILVSGNDIEYNWTHLQTDAGIRT